ncbi:MAG: T9SS type A sorting domain-containing protein [Bacteroidota bacterium]
MKRALQFLAILLATTFIQNANSQNFDWAYSTAKPSLTQAISIRKDNSDNFYLASQRDSSVLHLSSEIEKRDDSQMLLWNKIFTGDIIISDLELSPSGHPVVIGYYMDSLVIDGSTIHSGIFSYSGFICEFDPSGNLLFLNNVNPVNDDFRPLDLYITSNGDMYITSEMNGAVNDFTSFHKLDALGNIIKSEFNNNTEARTNTNIVVDDDGNVYLSGTCGNLAVFDSIQANLNFSYQNFVMKYDSTFKALWLHSRKYITFDHNNSLQLNGNYVYWAFDDFTDNSDTVKIIKIDLNGNIDREIAGPIAQSFFPSLQFNIDPQGNSVLAYEIYSRLILFRYDLSFNITMQDTIYTQASAFRRSSNIQCYDSTMYIAGLYYADTLQVGSFTLINANQTSNWPTDMFVCKWSQSDITSIEDLQESESPLTIYPNPATDKISFNFDLKESEEYRVRIFDNLGKNLIETVTTSKSIDVSSLSNGMYYFELVNGKQSVRNRFIKN